MNPTFDIVSKRHLGKPRAQKFSSGFLVEVYYFRFYVRSMIRVELFFVDGVIEVVCVCVCVDS
jgi:hypothetical protein